MVDSYAADRTWSGGGADGNWSTTANWSAVPDGNDNLLFGGTANLVTTNDLSATASSNNFITFNAGAGAFTLNGNAVSLDTAAMINNNSVNIQTINLDVRMVVAGTWATTSNSITMNGVVSSTGNFGLTKTGAATLFLNGANTYSNTTAINVGALRVGNSSALGTTNAGTTIASLATLELTTNSAGEGISLAENFTSVQGTGVGGTSGAIRNITGDNTITGLITLANATTIKSDAGTLGLNGNINVGGARALTFGGAGNIAMNGQITNSTAAVIKDGSGTLTLAGSNSFGATTIASGAVRAANSGALGTATTGTTITNGAALELITNSLGQGISLADAITGVGGTGINQGGAIRNIDGTNTLTGLITLTNTTRINSDSGTLTLDVTTGPAITNASAQNLTFGGAGNITVNDAIGILTGTLTKDGTGTLTLAASNTYGGVTTIGGGVLNVGTLANAGANSSIGTNATIAISNAGKLHYSGGTVSINRGVNLSGGDGDISVSNSAAALTISGAISNTGTLVKSGVGTLILTASNNYQGGTLLNAGTLAAGNAFAFGSGSVTIGSGTTLNLSNLSIANVLINNGGTLTNLGTVSGAELNGGTTTLASSNNTVAEVSGTATVDVIGANTTITNVTGGTVNVAGTNATIGTVTSAANVNVDTPGATITNLAGGTVNANANANVQSYVGGNVVVTNGANLVVESGNSAGSVSGGGNLVKTGTGTLVLSGNNSFTGTTFISNGVVAIGTNAALAGTTQVNLNNGTALAYTGGSATLDRNISVTNGTATIRNTGGGTLTLAGTLSKNGTVLVFSNGAFNVTGVISGASANSDLIVDNATVTLSNANTYVGPTIIRNAGDLTAAVVGAMPTGTRSAVIMDDAGSGSSVLNIDANQQIASLTGAASSSANIATNTSLTIGTTSGDTTFAGGIGGSGNLVKDDASTLTLSGASTFGGSTTIAGGTLSISADNNLGAAPGSATAGQLTFSNGATLAATTGFVLSSNRGIALGTGGGILHVASGQNLSYAGNMAGSGELEKTGAGTLTLSSSNSYTGMNTISAGTVRAENARALGSLNAGDAITLAGGNLQLAADTATTFGANSGYGTIISSNTTITSDRLTAGAGVAQQLGVLTMGAQTLTVEKGANVTSGTATLAIGGAATLTGNATFATATGTELRFDNTLSGAVNITKTGDGILTLNRGGGQVDTTITAGQLNINHFQALGTPAGTLTLGSGVTLDNTSGSFLSVGNAKSISVGSTLNFLGSSSLNLGNGTTTLTNNTAINVVANTFTLGGDVVGAFGLTKNGAGTLELAGLTGSNSFTGNSFINAGELFLSGTSVFGGTSNTIVTVETNAFLRIGASAGLGNVSLVLNNPDGLILAGIITNDVVFSNSGTISSTYANVDGSITIGEGVTMTTAANYLGTIPATNTPGRIVLDNNATLAATATFTINQNQGILLQPGVATFSPGTNVQVFIASSIAGDGELRKTGAGNIRLTGSNSYTGGTLIDQGIIGITSDSSLGAVSGRVKLNNGTLVAAQNNTGGPTNSGTTVNASRTIVLGNGTTNNIDAQTGLFFEYNGVIGEENGAGAASSMRFGIAGTREGTVKLGGLNTYDGSTTIVAGTLEISNIANGGVASGIGQSGNAASNLVIGGTLRYAGAIASTDRLFSLGSSGAGTIDSGSGTLAFTNTGAMGYAATNLTRHDLTLTGTGTGTLAVALVNDVHDDPLHIVKNGSGTWILSGTNDYTGTTKIAGGTLQVSADANLGRVAGSEGLVFTNGGTLKTSGSFTNSRVVAMAGAGTVDTDGNSVGFSGTVSGAGALTKSGAGTLSLATLNTYSGGTVLNAGTLRLANAGAAGSGTITQSNASSTLVIDTTGTVANAMSIYNIATLQSVTLSGAKTLNNATYNVTNNTTTTETGLLSGDGGVTKDGAGTLVIAGSASNTFTGATVVNSGSLVLSNSAGGALSGSNITVNSGAALVLAADNQIGNTTGLILNGGTFIVGNATAGYSDTLGTLTLSASSTIDLGSLSTGLRTLSFANSSAITWTGTLTITNWQGFTRAPSDVAQILFGTGGLTTTQLSQIYFANQDIDGGVLVGGNGELVPIPEAEVYWGALAIALAVGYRERRRLIAILQQIRR